MRSLRKIWANLYRRTPLLQQWYGRSLLYALVLKNVQRRSYDRGPFLFFRGSSLKELHTSPENRLQQKSNCVSIKKIMAQEYKLVSFRNKIDVSTTLG